MQGMILSAKVPVDKCLTFGMDCVDLCSLLEVFMVD